MRSGSLYTKKMGTLVRNMKKVCNRRVGEGINSLPSVKAHSGVFAHLYICDCSIDLAALLVLVFELFPKDAPSLLLGSGLVLDNDGGIARFPPRPLRQLDRLRALQDFRELTTGESD